MRIKISDISQGKLSEEQSEALQNYFQDGGTWQHLLNLSPEHAEELYRAGYEAYALDDYEKAISAFSALIQLNPYIDKHWLAIGAVLHAQKKYHDALAAYELALALNEDSIHALFYSAQAAWALEDKEKCAIFLDQIMEKGGRSAEEDSFVQKAHIIKRML